MEAIPYKDTPWIQYLWDRYIIISVPILMGH